MNMGCGALTVRSASTRCGPTRVIVAAIPTTKTTSPAWTMSRVARISSLLRLGAGTTFAAERDAAIAMAYDLCERYGLDSSGFQQEFEAALNPRRAIDVERPEQLLGAMRGNAPADALAARELAAAEDQFRRWQERQLAGDYD